MTEGNARMPLDETEYSSLEQLFRDQVIRDRSRVIQWVEKKRLGVYLPCKNPKNKVDYIFVGMEPSFNWAASIEDAERKIAGGYRNFSPSNCKEPLALLIRSIKRFLCPHGETYHLTDVSKGAMPVAMADIDRQQRYKEWYPLLLEEIEIVGKPGAPIIAIGKQVQNFLQQNDLKGRTGRPLSAVLHYSYQAARYWKTEAERDNEGFEAFKKAEFGNGSRWARDLSMAKMQLIFTYKKQFEKIRAAGIGVSSD